MKKTFLLLLFLGLLVLSGCGSEGKLEGVKQIKPEDIFAQKEDKYYVYFHRLDCADCEEASPTVIYYMSLLKEVQGCKAKRPVYSVLLYTKDEKPGQSVYIFREYGGTDGEGKEGTFKVTGITDWEELYIGATASLISISTDKSGVKKAAFEAQGADDIIQILSEQLGDCYK
ncbi:MAG TPA: hypothetical protein GX390_00085 [Acholeplasmataceae bacterium]|jgi:hypothetical protein|nr:hypothetical protein [Acholeplasmataceae bacterium]